MKKEKLWHFSCFYTSSFSCEGFIYKSQAKRNGLEARWNCDRL